MKLGTSKRDCPVDSNYFDCPHQVSEQERFSKIFPSSWLVCLFVGHGYYILYFCPSSVYSASSLRSEETADTIVNMKDLGDLVEEVNNKMVKGEGERLTRSTGQDIKLKKTCHLLLDLAP